MASPGFVVGGKGNPESLNSASHGAGRTCVFSFDLPEDVLTILAA
jgi:hypothetical protein